MMRALTLLTLALTGCAASSEARQAAVEDEVKKMRADVSALREELATVRARQDQLASKVDGVMRTAPSRQREPDPAKVYAVDVGDSPVRGGTRAQARVTIVEFSDFQCPFCARGQPTIAYLLDKYGDELRVVYKHNPLPFHAQAMPAAVATVCAHAQGKFWPMHDTIFARPALIRDEDLERHARDLQLDMRRWTMCVAGGAARARVEEDMAVAARFGARGTPTFFINGHFVSGAQPADVFSSIIDAELEKSRASVIPIADYYEQVVVQAGAKAVD